MTASLFFFIVFSVSVFRFTVCSFENLYKNFNSPLEKNGNTTLCSDSLCQYEMQLNKKSHYQITKKQKKTAVIKRGQKKQIMS
jgi:hypothetical protein